MSTVRNKAQKIRFILVGICNTTIDFAILFTLKSMGLPIVPANIISTTAAFCFSFFANRKYTFKDSGGNIKKQLPLFIVVTLAGLWGVQTGIIYLITHLFAESPINDEVILLFAKIVATAASLVWNYTFYSRVVFKSQEEHER